VSAQQGRTLLGAQYDRPERPRSAPRAAPRAPQARAPLRQTCSRLTRARARARARAWARGRYALRFTSSKDGFYETPAGGAERVEAGASYFEEFEEYAGCIALARALDRAFGKGVVRYQARPRASAPAAPPARPRRDPRRGGGGVRAGRGVTRGWWCLGEGAGL
jgi:hypothetical protein